MNPRIGAAVLLTALLAAGVTAAEPLTRDHALDIWRAENLIVRTSPEWHHTMFDTFPVKALVFLHTDRDDMMGNQSQFRESVDAFRLRHPSLTSSPPTFELIEVQVPDIQSMLELLRDPAVRSVGPDHTLTPQAGDSTIASSLALVRPLPGGYGGEGTTVAIIDTGLLTTSPIRQYSDRVVEYQVFNDCPGAAGTKQDNNGHGTIVTSIAAAAAPQAGIIVLQATDCSHDLNAAAAYRAQVWAYENAIRYNIAAVVMAYVGSVMYAGTCDNDQLSSMTGYLVARGAVPVAGSGQSSTGTGWKTGLPAPACSSDAVAVGMIGSMDSGWGGGIEFGKVPPMSNSGNRLAVLAPGGPLILGGHLRWGTSISAPFVAGAIATVQSRHKRSASQVIAAMRGHAGSASILDPLSGLSRPLLDVQKLVAEAIPSAPGTPSESEIEQQAMAAATVSANTITATIVAPSPPVVSWGCTSCHL